MRVFLLSLPPKLQLLIIILSTVVAAFFSSLLVHFCFGSIELVSKTALVTSIYAVLGTIYAVLVAFCVSGVWQNYCMAEMAVTSEVDALTDLIHIVKASVTEQSSLLCELAIQYVKLVADEEWLVLAKGYHQLLEAKQTKTYAVSIKIMRTIQKIEPRDAKENIIFSHALTLLSKWLDARRTRLMLSKGNIAKSLWPMLMTGAFILFAFHGLFDAESHLLWTALLLGFSSIIGLFFYLIFTLDSPYAGSPSIKANLFIESIQWLKNEEINE